MTIKSDKWIKHMVATYGMIENFCESQVKKVFDHNVISYGLSSYGYDTRCSNEFKILSASALTKTGIVDPKHIDDAYFIYQQQEHCIIPAHSFMLTTTIEKFKIPNNVLAICLGKSTYARCGVTLNSTPLEPGWIGHITLELSNTSPLPVKIYSNEGISQILFFESDEECEISYADRKGKYQNQIGISHAKV